MNYEWEFSAVWDAMPALLHGLRVTLTLSAIVMAISLICALPITLARLSRNGLLSTAAYWYTEIFRGTPMLVQIVWLFWVLPYTFGIGADVFVVAILALSLNLTAYVAEVYRAGIQSVDQGLVDAGTAIGMTSHQVLRRITLPIALRRSVPLLAAIWISLFKDTSLVAFIGVHELMFTARKLVVDTYRPMEVLSVAAALYFLVSYPQSLVINRLFERYRVQE